MSYSQVFSEYLKECTNDSMLTVLPIPINYFLGAHFYYVLELNCNYLYHSQANLCTNVDSVRALPLHRW